MIRMMATDSNISINVKPLRDLIPLASSIVLVRARYVHLSVFAFSLYHLAQV